MGKQNLNNMKEKFVKSSPMFFISLGLVILGVFMAPHGNIHLWTGVVIICSFFPVVKILIIIFDESDRVEREKSIELEKYRNDLWKKYSHSLSIGDKSNSLLYGRLYYGTYGIFDEQRIQNDLLCHLKIK